MSASSARHRRGTYLFCGVRMTVVPALATFFLVAFFLPAFLAALRLVAMIEPPG